MQEIIRAGDDHFITWAVNAVLEWENKEIPQPFYHIHGTRDEIFPIGLTTPTHIVEKGDHMFVVSRPDVVNSLLKEILLNLPQQEQV